MRPRDDSDPLTAEIESPVRAKVGLPTEDGIVPTNIRAWLTEEEPANILARARGINGELVREVPTDSAQVQLSLGWQARVASYAEEMFDISTRLGLDSKPGLNAARLAIHWSSVAGQHGERALKLLRELNAIKREQSARQLSDDSFFTVPGESKPEAAE